MSRRCNHCQRKFNRNERVLLNLRKGRCLSVNIKPTYDGKWWYIMHLKTNYGSRISARCNRKYQQPGKTLRSKVHHVPKYKYDRGNIKEAIFPLVKSSNSHWSRARAHSIKLTRLLNTNHFKYMENNLQPHWWAI